MPGGRDDNLPPEDDIAQFELIADGRMYQGVFSTRKSENTYAVAHWGKTIRL